MSSPAGPDRRLTVALTGLAYFMVPLDALVVVTADVPVSPSRDLAGVIRTD